MNKLRVITMDELKAILVKHNEGKERANLSNADLSYADLSNADLSYANLSNADLSYANLSNADLRYANLSNADLSYANLSNADLSYADLRYADLSYANLSNADLSYANLILVGQDIRGYLFWAFVGDSGAVELRAGCRWLKGISAMCAHWQARHAEDEILREDCLSLVDRCERMAKVRGWKLEPDA